MKTLGYFLTVLNSDFFFSSRSFKDISQLTDTENRLGVAQRKWEWGRDGV